MEIFPNPGNGEINLSLNNLSFSEATLEIIDVTGKMVFKEDLKFSALNFQKRYKFDLSSGLYYLTLNHQNLSRSEKFIVEKND
jgi:hypothetical protein